MMPARKAAQQQKMRNKLIARIGWHSAWPGVTPEAVSEALGSQVSPAQVSAAWQLYSFAPKVLLPGCEVVAIPLAGRHRTMICREAQSRGMDMPDLVERVLAKTVDDGLFDAVLDG